MKNINFLILKSIEINLGKKFLNEVLKVTSDDIKANRIAYGKRTGSREFMDIFFKSLKVCVKAGVGN